jgi:two-component system, NarL family, response regulator DevR
MQTERVSQSQIAETAVVCDQHDIYRRGLRAVLDEMSVRVVAETAALDRLPALVAQHGPALAVVDGEAAPADFYRRLAEGLPANLLVVFVVSADVTGQVIRGLVEAGAAGVVSRTLPAAGLKRSIAAVLKGQVALSRAFTTALATSLRTTGLDHDGDRVERLTGRERAVLALVAHGARNRDIAQTLSISEYTVKRHVHNILGKLEVPTRAAAATLLERSAVTRLR